MPFSTIPRIRHATQFAAIGLFSALVTLAIAGCNSDQRAEDTGAAATAGSTSAADPSPGGDSQTIVEVETTVGRIVIRLDAENAPGTVKNFLGYVDDGFYDGTLFHYVEPGKMIVGGGYNEAGDLKPTRLTIRSEAHNGLKNLRGTVAMARDPEVVDSATCQFFINLVDAPEFDFVENSPEKYGYCVFGKVVEGLDVAEKISHVATTDRGGDLMRTPKTPVVITSVNRKSS